MENHGTTILVIGAGVVGCSIARALAKVGRQVILVDEHARPFEGMSKAGFGSLTPYSDPFFTGPATELAAKGVQLYREQWIPELRVETGQRITFEDAGLIRLCQTETELATAARHVSSLLASGFKAQVLSVDQVRNLEPHLLGDFLGGVWLEDEPWMDIVQYYGGLAESIVQNSRVSWLPNSTVCCIKSDEANLTAVLADGSSLAADFLVVCTGLHPESIQGLPCFPMKWVRGDAILACTTDGRPLLRRHVYQSHGFITPREDGRMLLGATYCEEDGVPSRYARIHRDRIQIDQLTQLIGSNLAILPELESCDICEVWRGWRATPPDNLPIIGESPTDRRVVFANGFIGLGVTMAPAAAHVVRDYLITSNPAVFCPAFSPARFEKSKAVQTP